MSALDPLATTIRKLFEVWRIGASAIDIAEVDVVAHGLVALHRQKLPANPMGDYAIAYWEDRIAILLVMQEAVCMLALRFRYDRTTLDLLDTVSKDIAHLANQARTARHAVQHYRFTRNHP